jgi:hypothetical protein
MEIDDTRLLVAWKPHGHGNFLCESPERRALLGAIKAVPGQDFDLDTYFSLLGDRVQEILEADEDPASALDQMYEAFDGEGLAQMEKPALDQVGRKLIFANWGLREHFNLLGLPGPLPKRLEKNDPDAAKVIEETGIGAWCTNLFMKPYYPDR